MRRGYVGAALLLGPVILLGLFVGPADASPVVCTVRIGTACQGLDRVLAIAAGATHSCVLQEARDVFCFGGNGTGQSAPQTRGDVLSIGLGYAHSCARVTGGDVVCWGRNTVGQASGRAQGDVLALSVGMEHTCYLTVDSNVTCVGWNQFGQAAGYGGGDAIAIVAGGAYTCALLTSGNATCWGGSPDSIRRGYGGGDAIAIFGGSISGIACVLTSARVLDCWGKYASGSGDWTYSGGDVVAVSTGRYQTCVLVESGNVFCRRGFGDAHGADAPYEGGDAVALVSGEEHNCVLTTSDRVICWGSDFALDGRGKTNGYNGRPILPVVDG